MKHKFIWKDINREFHFLWIWRIALVYATTFEDEKKVGIQIGKRSALAWYRNFALGIGHSIGSDVIAYDKPKCG